MKFIENFHNKWVLGVWPEFVKSKAAFFVIAGLTGNLLTGNLERGEMPDRGRA